jgi:uncharacterized cupin superfamily protein
MPDDLPIHIDEVPSPRREFGEIAAARRRLGFAAGAKRLGVALIEIDPGKRSTPPHSHADEDELFLVLAGSGLSYQTSGSQDVRTYPIGVDASSGLARAGRRPTRHLRLSPTSGSARSSFPSRPPSGRPPSATSASCP